ncbi:MAG TPA: ABC transporter ATP-binding protein [Beijerinckiaceae bacterium]|nr:ABC transporter ATP-binding protein [Beijerinckiaceae bacterium]
MNETRNIAVGFYDVKKTFTKGNDSLTVLDKVTLQTEENELTCIVGPSGCGKSTLLNLVAGLSPVDAGRVEFRGRAVTSVNKDVGYITQDSNLLPWCTVLENIELPLDIRHIGKTPAERRSLALEWIEMVGLGGFAHHYPHQLSGGMQKRVSIARTLVYDPDVILMDEPFGPLDAITKMTLQNLLLKLWQERQKTIIFVTHDLMEAITLGDRVVIMTRRPGAVKAVLPVAMARPRDAFSLTESPEYAVIHRQFWELMRSEVDAGSDHG